MSSIQQWASSADAEPWTKVNASLLALAGAFTFAEREAAHSGLVVGIGGGPFNGATIADTTVTCTDNTTNYIVALRSTGAISTSTATTNWNDPLYGRIARAVFATGVRSYFDERFGPDGILRPSTSGAGDVVGPASATDSHFAQFDGTTGKLLKGGISLDTDGTLAANSNTRVATQAAVKAYADALAAGLAWKQPVRAASTAAGTLATDYENGDTLDGVVLATGDRILLKNQAAGAENGIYIVSASGAPARANDANAGAELVNASFYVSEGTTNADSSWVCTTNAPITIGTTALVFAQFNGGGGITALTGDVTATGPGSAAATVANDAITNAKAANMATKTYKGRTSAATGDPEDVAVATLRADLGEKVESLTDGATISVDASLANNFRVTLGGNRTLANPTNLISGQVLNFRISQDATGSRTLSYGTKYKWPGGTAGILSTAASAKDFLSCQYDVTDDTLFCVLNKAFA